MKRILPYMIAVALTFLGGVSADLAFNYDYYQARARYLEYRRLHPYRAAGGATANCVPDAPVKEKQPRR